MRGTQDVEGDEPPGAPRRRRAPPRATGTTRCRGAPWNGGCGPWGCAARAPGTISGPAPPSPARTETTEEQLNRDFTNRPGRPVGRRHHLRADLGRVRVRRVRDRPVARAPHRGLAGVLHAALRPGPGRTGAGHLAAPTARAPLGRAGPPLRPRPASTCPSATPNALPRPASPPPSGRSATSTTTPPLRPSTGSSRPGPIRRRRPLANPRARRIRGPQRGRLVQPGTAPLLVRRRRTHRYDTAYYAAQQPSPATAEEAHLISTEPGAVHSSTRCCRRRPRPCAGPSTAPAARTGSTGVTGTGTGTWTPGPARSRRRSPRPARARSSRTGC